MNYRARLILAIVGSILVAIAFFFLFIRPRQADLKQLQSDVEAEEGRTSALQAELSRLQALQENAPKLRAELTELRSLVPVAHEVPNFIFLVQAAANASGVDFLTITPNLPDAPIEGAALAQVQVSVLANGSYFSVQDFIRRLYNLDRALRLDTFTLSGSESETGAVELGLSGGVRIFFELPGAAAPAPAPVAPAGTTPEATPVPTTEGG